MGSVAFLIGLTFLAIGIFAIMHDWIAMRQISFAMSGAVGLNIIMKWIVHRARPEELYANTMPASYSFPSGHALYSLTFYVTIAMILGRRSQSYQSKAIWSVAVGMFVLIGTSRIFLGVHYGSDVFGGYLIAAIWLLFLAIPTASERNRPRQD
jgi:undecaprenyl-diphosphatase